MGSEKKIQIRARRPSDFMRSKRRDWKPTKTEIVDFGK
jgi:hypothetical protein